MAKKKNNRRQRPREEGMDKPAYAMDIFEDKPKKPEKEKPKEETFHLGDSLRGDVANQLEALKAQLSPAEETKTPLKKPAKKKPSAAERLSENPELSFSELFDPEDDDEETFDALLNDSKLDWRLFKDE